jgi:hypothetical protein
MNESFSKDNFFFDSGNVILMVEFDVKEMMWNFIVQDFFQIRNKKNDVLRQPLHFCEYPNKRAMGNGGMRPQYRKNYLM